MNGAYTLSVTHAEAMGLHDHIPAPTDEDDTYRLILAIGSALLETAPTTAPPANIVVDLYELRLLRSYLKTNMMVGKESVGYDLLLKVYAGLVKLESDAAIGSVTEQSEGAGDTVSLKRQKRLDAYRARQEKRRNPNG